MSKRKAKSPTRKRTGRPRALPSALVQRLGDPPAAGRALRLWLARAAAELLLAELRGEVSRTLAASARASINGAAKLAVLAEAGADTDDDWDDDDPDDDGPGPRMEPNDDDDGHALRVEPR